MHNERFFFCYSFKLADFLIREKKLSFITKAKHTKTNMIFWLFERSEQLENCLEEYENL